MKTITKALHCIVIVMIFVYNIIGGDNMQKDATISLRLDSELKADVEAILKELGIPMTTAITMYFNQIKMRNGLPFTPVIVNKPKAYTDYTEDELAISVSEAMAEYNSKNVYSANEIETEMKKKYKL